MTRRMLAVFSCILVPLASFVRAQDVQEAATKKGAELYAANCTGFCHGETGASGSGGPQLSNRGLESVYIESAVTYGIAGTAMPGWGERLTRQDLQAVIAYVKALNGIATAREIVSAAQLAPEAARGSNLFSELPDELARCSMCHRVNDRGLPVARPITNVPSSVGALRELATARVSMATAGAETFPALLVTERRDVVKLYDLTRTPPVLRTFAPGSVTFNPGSSWRHASFLGAYSDADLESVLAYLRFVQP